MKQFKIIFEYLDNTWITSCEELRITLEGHSFDELISRIKMAVKEIVETELNYKGNIKLIITVQDRIEEMKVAG